MLGKFDVMYGDLPWPYANRLTGKGRSKFGEGASGHYNTMTDKELWAMGPLVRDVLADRAVVFQWVTPPKADFAMDCFRHWGLKYVTVAFSWYKLSAAGNPLARPSTYSSSNKEDVWLLTYNRKKTSNKLTPAECGGRRMTPQVYVQDAYELEPWEEDLALSLQTPDGGVEAYATVPQQHSRKPDVIRDRITQMYPGQKRIELFCRFPDPHYSSLGIEIDGLDIRDALALAAGGYYDLAEGDYRVGIPQQAQATHLPVRPGDHRLATQRRAHRAYRACR